MSDQKKVYVRKEEQNFLSPFFPTEIILKYNGSKIIVIIPGAENRVYMQVSDSSFFPKTISFRTSKDNIVRFFYDCPMGSDAFQDDEISGYAFPETVS